MLQIVADNVTVACRNLFAILLAFLLVCARLGLKQWS